MELALGLPILAVLVVGLIAVRRVVTRRRRSLEAYTHTRDERLKRSRPKVRRTSRSEMRANDDPTTVIDTIRQRNPKPSRSQKG